MGLFLPGVPEDHIRARMCLAGGNEIDSGKFAHPESSAALAANTFGWFIERPALLPPLPGIEGAWPAVRVEVEYCARFPWSGGRHPWLDAIVVTETHLAGVESKRFEPFRDRKLVSFSPAFREYDWGSGMDRYSTLRDMLANGDLAYRHLDAAQLIKHAYGLTTEGRRQGLKPHLVYVFAEPEARESQIIPHDDHLRHRAELRDFAERVDGDEVGFSFTSYCDWLSGADGAALEHAAAVLGAYRP